MALSSSRLQELLDYNPKTGVFTWRVNRPGRFARAGVGAGTITKSGHRQICIDKVIYPAARLALFYITGNWPKQVIDHINGNPGDDHWSNLREADNSTNAANSPGRKTKRYSPLKGVTWHHGKFAAQIKVNYRVIWLGRFNTAEEAHAAYCKAACKYFGNFARFS